MFAEVVDDAVDIDDDGQSDRDFETIKWVDCCRLN